MPDLKVGRYGWNEILGVDRISSFLISILQLIQLEIDPAVREKLLMRSHLS